MLYRPEAAPRRMSIAASHDKSNSAEVGALFLVPRCPGITFGVTFRFGLEKG